MQKHAIILVLFVLISSCLFSQIGGSYTYAFLNLPNSARIAGMGGNVNAIKDNDISLALVNPSLITSKMNNQIALSFVDYFSDINYGFASYAHDFKKVGTFDASLQFINYGKFTTADETGVTYGEFTAGEYCFNIGWGRQLDSSFSIGANLKNIYSHYDEYTSYGIAVDVGGTFSRKNFAATLLALNIGRQIKYFTDGNDEPLPFEIQAGISQKLARTPFRYSVVLRNLQKFDLTYTDPNNPEPTVDALTGEPLPEKKFGKFMDKCMRHVVVGGELTPSKNFSIRLGYNYQRRKELKVDSKTGTVGFCWGFGFRVKQFHFNYARAAYHLVGSPNHITISTNLSDIFKGK
ncbi:MAG TPA: type IX secretion system protein PorQ [Bacteroidales bacterium]|nr:type IX secretion system protein PorQ [Bacteroidales bacterium]HPS17387.1 type IX secretion system protein PorQ [Bacteroidales bacterium]